MPDEGWAALLTPEGGVLRRPDDVDRAFARLWESAQGQHAGSGEHVTATRVCVANLIVVASEEGFNAVNDVLGDLSPHYPTRTLVVLLDSAGQTRDIMAGPGRGVRASVSALCHVPQPGQPQVCCEQVVLGTAADDGRDLDRTLLPLLEADVPTMAWWLPDPGRWPELWRCVASRADRLIVDAGLAGLHHLTPGDHAAVRELGWYRTAQWREVLAGMFDGSPREIWGRIEALEVAAGGDRVEDRIDAIWVAAFVAGQLGWQAVKALGTGEHAFRADDREVRVRLTLGGKRLGLQAVVFGGGGTRYEVRADDEAPGEFRVLIHDERVCHLPRCIELPQPSRAQSLAAAMTGRVVDAAFMRAAPLAERLAREWCGK